MLSLNRAQLIGNLTKDAEMRFTPNGQAVATISIATNRKWKGRDGAAGGEDVQYHDVVIWGQQAETLTPMLKKGSPVYAEGRLQTRNWEGQDGVKRYKTEIVAETVILLGSRGSGNYTPSNSEPANPVENISAGVDAKTSDKKEDEIDIDEIPF